MADGPKVRKLIVRKLAADMIPAGTKDPLAAGANAIMDGRLGERAREATRWVREAIAVVKTAPNNKWGDDDEAIAGEILRRIALTRPEPESKEQPK